MLCYDLFMFTFPPWLSCAGVVGCSLSVIGHIFSPLHEGPLFNLHDPDINDYSKDVRFDPAASRLCYSIRSPSVNYYLT